jgi:hypothetical protein
MGSDRRNSGRAKFIGVKNYSVLLSFTQFWSDVPMNNATSGSDWFGAAWLTQESKVQCRKNAMWKDVEGCGNLPLSGQVLEWRRKTEVFGFPIPPRECFPKRDDRVAICGLSVIEC